MKELDTGKDKVKKICDVLRKETIEPAKQEAESIIEEARKEAEKIIKEAHTESAKLHHEAKQEIEKNRAIFQASLSQASRQTLELLKQEIEEKLFNKELSAILMKELKSPTVIVDLINAVMKALEKDGLDADLSIYIPAAVPVRSINDLLAEHILNKLREKSVLLSTIDGGIEVKLHKENMRVDISEAALKSIIANYIRKDFRELFFRA